MKASDETQLIEICRVLNSKPMNTDGYPRKLSFLLYLFYSMKFIGFVFLIFLCYVIGLPINFLIPVIIYTVYLLFKMLKRLKKAKQTLKPYFIKTNFSYKDWLMVFDSELSIYKMIHHQKFEFLKIMMDNPILDIANPHHYYIHKGFDTPKRLKEL